VVIAGFVFGSARGWACLGDRWPAAGHARVFALVAFEAEGERAEGLLGGEGAGLYFQRCNSDQGGTS